MSQDLGEGDERPERVVEVAVEKDLLDIAAAEATESGAHDGPVVPQQGRFLKLL